MRHVSDTALWIFQTRPVTEIFKQLELLVNVSCQWVPDLSPYKVITSIGMYVKSHPISKGMEISRRQMLPPIITL